MSLSSHRFFLSILNFLSVFCFTLEGKTFEISNFLALCNVLKVPFVIFFNIYIMSDYSLKVQVFRNTFVSFDKFSIFAKLVVSIVAISGNVTILIISLLQVSLRHKIKNFANILIQQSLHEKYFRKFKKISLDHSIKLTILSFAMVLFMYRGAFKNSVIAFAACLIHAFPLFLTSGLIGFLIAFHDFIVSSLKEFKHDLKSCQNFDIKNCLQLSKKYQNIYELMEQFNDCFGRQLTVVTCFLVAMLVFCVSF